MFFALLVAAFAALTPHVTLATSASVSSAKAGSTVKLFVDVIPDANIHVYAPGAKDYLPVVLELVPQAGVTVARLTYPKSQIWFFEPLKERVPVYQTPFRLVQDIALGPSLKSGRTVTLTGVLKYQACSDTVCFNPVSAPVSWTVTVK